MLLCLLLHIPVKLTLHFKDLILKYSKASLNRTGTLHLGIEKDNFVGSADNHELLYVTDWHVKLIIWGIYPRNHYS